MSEQQLKSAADQWRIVVHDELEQDAQERLSASSVQIQVGQILFVSENLFRLVDQSLVSALLSKAHLFRGAILTLVGFLEDGQQVGEPVVQSHVQYELKVEIETRLAPTGHVFDHQQGSKKSKSKSGCKIGLIGRYSDCSEGKRNDLKSQNEKIKS